MFTIRGFDGGADRYRYDFDLCTYAKGWAQLDSDQDASYFGNWINPTERKAVCFMEGDVVTHTFESDAEMVEYVEGMEQFELEQGRRPPRIDPGLNAEFKQRIVAAGLGGYIH